MSTLKRIRLALWAFAATAVVLAATLVLGAILSGRETVPTADAWPGAEARFELVTDDGRRVTQADFRGRPSIWFFGFTHCPDVCPTTLFELGTLLQELGADADRLTPVFVTVDPARDTQQALAQYMDSFDPRIVALTGPEPDVEALLDAYRVYYRKVPTEAAEAAEGGDYTMDHTASIYLLDAQGRLAGTLGYQAPAEAKLTELRRLVAEGS